MSDSQGHILVVMADPHLAALLDRTLRAADFTVTLMQDGTSAVKQAGILEASLVILGERLRDGAGLDCAVEFSRRLPALPLLFYANQESPDLLKRAMRAGIGDFLSPPFNGDEVTRAVRGALEASIRRKDTLLFDARRFTSSLQRQVDEMETLTRLCRQITSSLDLDTVLSSIVDAAVQLTGSEEGSLLLVDEATGELYMRASRNFQEDFVRTFRLPITDSLAGSVIRSGEPVLVDGSQPQKIKTSYLVQNLLYVPLQMQGHVLGVLGVDNRHNRVPFTQRHVSLLSALSGYAVIALENARLFADISAERNKLEAILTGIQDGVVIVDQDQRLGIVNQAVRAIFDLDPEKNLNGKFFRDVFPQNEMLDLVEAPENSVFNRTEISPDDSRVYSVMATPIQGVGRVLTLHDITNLRKLDRIKTDFVHTVSHDLRSPLTAIMGYVELIERAGAVNDTQRDFIRRIQVSVRSISGLVDDLLDLGRVEAGFDVRKENVHLAPIVRYAAEGLKKQFAEKSIHLQIDIPTEIPTLLANPIQLRQMVDHLLDNAIKYSLPGGTISVTGQVEQNQAILRFSDTGIGIPAIDLPYIFDKFYRAANTGGETLGSGLGLAIVKSIAENHGGRVWVESIEGKGSTFTVVLPISQQ